MSKAPKTALANQMYDHKIENMIYLQEQGRMQVKLSRAMTRPAYAYTSIQQKRIFPKNECDRCGYWKKTEFWERVCTYPFENPSDYDLAAYDYLPCKEGLTYEKN